LVLVEAEAVSPLSLVTVTLTVVPPQGAEHDEEPSQLSMFQS
jgi:hypothetical protein